LYNADNVIPRKVKNLVNEKRIINGIEISIKILDSALKHGITKENILFALDNILLDEMIDNDPNKTLVIGFDQSANLLEIVTYEMEDDYLVVFHAMSCRKEYLKKLSK